MNPRLKKYFLLICLFIFLLTPGLSQARNKTVSKPEVIFFYSLTCHQCAKVKNQFMPEVIKKFGSKIILDYRDIGDIHNYKLLIGLKEKYGYATDGNVPIIFLRGRLLIGEKQIEEYLPILIEDALNKQEEEANAVVTVDLAKNFLSFSPLAVAGAGLIDGINPCAFTVIVFFISFLALQGYRKRDITAIGLSFIISVFITYLLIGVGSFAFLYRLNKFWHLAKAMNFSIGLFSIILGVLALYDFYKFRKTGRTEGLVLQLPQVVKNQIHKIIGLHYRVQKNKGSSGNRKHLLLLIISALTTGFLVSILESICTGQTYLPTITFILKSGQLRVHAAAYLLLYNFMFILPLLAIFIFALLGVTSEQFSSLLKKHILAIKVLMSLLFFGLGILLIWNA